MEAIREPMDIVAAGCGQDEIAPGLRVEALADWLVRYEGLEPRATGAERGRRSGRSESDPAG